MAEQAKGFEGEIRLRAAGPRRAAELDGADRGRPSASARRGPATDPAVTLRTSVPDFVPLAAREAFPPKLLLEGSLVIEGDFALAGRLGEMFGAGPPT